MLFPERRPFLDHPEIAAIFDYYRIQRKLEYILRQTTAEAARRIAGSRS